MLNTSLGIGYIGFPHAINIYYFYIEFFDPFPRICHLLPFIVRTLSSKFSQPEMSILNMCPRSRKCVRCCRSGCMDSLIVTGGLERAIISAHPYPVLQIDMEIKGGPTVVSHLVIRAFGICLLRFNAAARAPSIHARLRIDKLVLLARQLKNDVPMHREWRTNGVLHKIPF